MWQNFIDECLIHIDENVQVCILSRFFVDCKCIADIMLITGPAYT